jgi:hypothetical protein
MTEDSPGDFIRLSIADSPQSMHDGKDVVMGDGVVKQFSIVDGKEILTAYNFFKASGWTLDKAREYVLLNKPIPNLEPNQAELQRAQEHLKEYDERKKAQVMPEREPIERTPLDNFRREHNV